MGSALFIVHVLSIRLRLAVYEEHNPLSAGSTCLLSRRYARMRASDAKYHSPFSYAAIQAGYVYLGGKMDDITVVVSYVTLPSRV